MAKGTNRYLDMEQRLREDLENPRPPLASPEWEAAVNAIPAVVERLKEIYLADKNPTHVWHAIMQLSTYAQQKGLVLSLPPWIHAYMATAAKVIVGTAVNRPELQQTGPDAGKKPTGRAPAPIRADDGSAHYYSGWFGGCRPAERVRIAQEALRFTSVQGGANPFLRAHRLYRDQEWARTTGLLKAEGLTDEEVAERMDDPQLKRVADPVRALRRSRKRARQVPKVR